jgi:hypothetical protein
MEVQGAVLACRLREVWPTLLLTETHPKVLWHCLQINIKYPRQEARTAGGALTVIDEWLEGADLTGSVTSEDEFDAVFSAWAALQAHSKNWTHDLFQIRAVEQTSDNISLVPDVHYFWPE